MVIEVKEAGKKLYDSLKEIISDYINFLKTVNNFEKKWDIQVFTSNEISLVENLEKELSMLEPQIKRIKKKCVVFGKTFVGKSSFINALLKENILPTSFGTATTIFCKVKASPDNSNYFKIRGSDIKYRPDEIRAINTENRSRILAERDQLKLFYNREICELLKNDVVIIDTPGMDTTADMDTNIENVCKNADVILLLINSQGTLSLSDWNIFREYRTIFSKLTVFIVYTFWDVVHRTDITGSIKEDHIKNAITLLRDEFNHKDKMDLKNIFFLSGQERLKMFSADPGNPHIIENELSEERKENFDSFFNVLKVKLSENAFDRLKKYLKPFYKKLLDVKGNSIVSLNQILLKSDEIVQQINLNDNKKDQINKNINAEISRIFTNAFEEFVITGSDDIENKKETKSNEYTKLSIEPQDMLKDLLNQIIEKSLTETKERITEIVPNCKDESYLKVLEKFYFPNYLDLKKQTESVNIDCMVTNLLEIKKKVLHAKIGVGVATGVLGLVGLAAGGIGLAVVGAVEVAVAVGAISTAGGIAAGATAGGVSVGIITAAKRKMYFLCKDNIQNMTAEWNKLESALLNSFSRFMDDAPKFSPIQAEFRKFESKLDAWKEKKDYFQNLSNTQ